MRRERRRGEERERHTHTHKERERGRQPDRERDHAIPNADAIHDVKLCVCIQKQLQMTQENK